MEDSGYYSEEWFPRRKDGGRFTVIPSVPPCPGGWCPNLPHCMGQVGTVERTKIRRHVQEKGGKIRRCRKFLLAKVPISVAGVSRVCDASRTPRRRVSWCIVVLATILFMTYMTYKVIREYFEYKKTVERTSVLLGSLEFPAVTLCSPVTLPRSRLREAGLQHLVQIEAALHQPTKSDPDGRGWSNETDEEVSQLLSAIRSSGTDDLSDVQTTFEPDVYSVAHYGMTFEDMVVGCSFLKQRCGKSNFTVFYTSSQGKCYTFNYVGEQLGIPKSPLETKKYGKNNGLQLYLQIPEEEIVTLLSREVAVNVVIHDPRTLPYVSEYGLAVRTGDSASLRVERLQVNRLGRPWGRCLSSGSHLPFNYSDRPYSQLGCQRSCQNFYLQERCGCQRRSLLPPSVRRPDAPRPTDALCNLRLPLQKKCMDDTIEMIENETIRCDCHQACKERLYQTSLTAGRINEEFFRLVSAVRGEPFTLHRSSILGVKVYYGMLSVQNTTEGPAYSWETLIANIGGNLGFFMGLTLITFFEIAEVLCDLMLRLLATNSR